MGEQAVHERPEPTGAEGSSGSTPQSTVPPESAMPGPLPTGPIGTGYRPDVPMGPPPAWTGGGPTYPPGPYYAPPTAPRQGGVPWYTWLIGGVVALFLIGAVACVAIGASIGNIFNRVANSPTERMTVSQTYTVGAAPTIITRNVTGTTTIVRGGDGTVSAQVTKIARASTASSARNDLDQINVLFNQSGDVVTVNVEYPGSFNWPSMLSADILLTVPANSHLDVNVVTGTVNVTDISVAGASKIDVTTGTVDFTGALQTGASLDVRVVTGSVLLDLPRDTPARLNASVTTGNITITGWSIPVSGELTHHTATGDLGVNPTGTVSAQVTTGSITLSAR